MPTKQRKVAIKYTQISGFNVRYLEAGSPQNKATLMVHGGGISSWSKEWHGMMPEISAYSRALAPDLPGYGKSEHGNKKATLENCSEFLSDFVASFAPGRINIIGESFGGGIALDYTLKHKDTVDKLVLIDSYGFFNKKFSMAAYLLTRIKPEVQNSLINIFVDNTAVSNLILKLLIRDREGSNIREAEIDFVRDYIKKHGISTSCLEFVQDQVTRNGTRSYYMDRIHELNGTNVSVMFIHGNKDPLFPIEKQREAASKIKSEFVEVNASHTPMLKERRLVIGAINSFLRN